MFDEAHRLRNVYKKDGATRAKRLRDATRPFFKILLTATPLQNSLMELYGLVSVLDERHFGDENSFRNQYVVGPGRAMAIFSYASAWSRYASVRFVARSSRPA